MLLFLVLVRRLQTICSLVGPEPLVQVVPPLRSPGNLNSPTRQQALKPAADSRRHRGVAL